MSQTHQHETSTGPLTRSAVRADTVYAIPVRTNTLAVWSLVASLVGLFIVPIVGSIVGVITGHLALRQLKTTNESGRGMALAGTILGWLGLVALIIALVVLIVLLPGIIAEASTNSR